MSAERAWIIVPDWLLPSPDPASLCRSAVLVRGADIAALGPPADLARIAPEARELSLPGCLLTAGLINAHQHGRGLGTVALGFPDDALERWLAGRGRRGPNDAYELGRHAARRMIANGVTTAIHANTTLGTGDYEAEIRAQLAAYADAGLRVVMCVGFQDRCFTVYPEAAEAAFIDDCPPELAALLRARRSPYAADLAATRALLDRLMAGFQGHPTTTFCWGPAGPQWVSDAALAAIADDARDRGIGVHMHAMESPAQARVARDLYPGGVARHLDRLGLVGAGTVFAHGVWFTAEDIAVIADRGATIVRNPGSNLRLRNGVAPLARWLAAGVRVALGSDNTALDDDEDLLGELRLATDLAYGAVSEADTLAVHRPTIEDQWRMVTTAAAAAAGLDRRIGLVAPGMAADLVAFDLKATTEPYLDPTVALPAAFLRRGRGRDVRLVMVDGRVLHQGAPADRIMAVPALAAAATASLAAADPDMARWRDELLARVDRHYRAVLASPSGTP